jgi:hypothetical protein
MSGSIYIIGILESFGWQRVKKLKLLLKIWFPWVAQYHYVRVNHVRNWNAALIVNNL